MSYVTGSHNVGAGIHFRLARRADDHFINNSMTLGFRGNVPAEVTLWASPFRNEVRQRVVGLYAQAIRWDPGRREHPELPHRAALVQGSEHQGFRHDAAALGFPRECGLAEPPRDPHKCRLRAPSRGRARRARPQPDRGRPLPHDPTGDAELVLRGAAGPSTFG